MINNNLSSLALFFGMLSLVSIGGGNTVLPDIHREAVLVHHWMTENEFAAAFAIAQAAPGPGSLIVALVGWKAAGLLGAIVAITAMFAPASILACFTGRIWRRFQNTPWQAAVEKGLAPITIGLVFASGWIVSQQVNQGVLSYAFTLATALAVAKTKINPLWLMGLAGLAGICGIM